MKTARDPLNVSFGAALRTRRLAAGLSLEALGDRIGVTYQQIQKYETGANRVAIATGVRIAAVLGCRLEDLTAALEAETDRTAPPMPSARALRLAGRIDSLSDENRETLAALIDIFAEASERRVPPPRPAEPAALAH